MLKPLQQFQPSCQITYNAGQTMIDGSSACHAVGCTLVATARPLNGALYCPQHYNEGLTRKIESALLAWVIPGSPPAETKSILGRMHDEFDQANNDSYISAARIRDRGWDWRRESNGNIIRFSITRHQGAWTRAGAIERVVQHWEIDVPTRLFRLTGTRPWAKGDPDL